MPSARSSPTGWAAGRRARREATSAGVSRLDPALPLRSRQRRRRARDRILRRRAARRGRWTGVGRGPRDGSPSHVAARHAGHGLPARAHRSRLRRYAHPLSADRRDRLLRRAAPRLAGALHVPGRTPLLRGRARARRERILPRRAASQRHDHRARIRHRAPPVGRRLLRGRGGARHAHDRRQGPHGPALPR